MEKIHITIPDNLDTNGELLAIVEELGKNLLPSGTKLLNSGLGSGYEIKHLETQIIIKRESVEKPIAVRECSICSTLFDQKVGKKLWINYGGNQKQRHYCSNDCREVVLELVGNGRASINKSKLTPVRIW